MASYVTSFVDARNKAFALCASSFCLGKRNQNRFRRTRSGAAAPHRAPALLGRRGTRPKLAALKHGPLSGPATLRCSARFTAREIKSDCGGDYEGSRLLLLVFARSHEVVRRPVGRRPWMGGVFRPSHGWRVGKSREASRGDFAVSGKAFFFGSFLLTLIKRNEPVRAADGSPALLLFHQQVQESSWLKRFGSGEAQTNLTQEKIR